LLRALARMAALAVFSLLSAVMGIVLYQSPVLWRFLAHCRVF